MGTIEMEHLNGKDKELAKILNEGAKPFREKCDGYAIKMQEDKKITYNDFDGQELTLTVAKGDYIKVDKDCNYPKIVTAEEFEKNNEFLSGGESPKKDKKGFGISMLIED